MMRIDWSALQGKFAGNQKYGHLTMQLEQMSAAVSRLRPLGSYRAEVELAGADGTLQLKTTAGPLYLEGRARSAGRHASMARHIPTPKRPPSWQA